MTIYRLAHIQYSSDLTGTGARKTGARWNSKGTAMLYCASHISLALLELLVHARTSDFSIPMHLLHIHLPDGSEGSSIELPKLKKNWVNDLAYTQFMGDAFCKSGHSLYLKVPSAIVPEEQNIIINPMHPDSKKIRVSKTTTFRTDKRLLGL